MYISVTDKTCVPEHPAGKHHSYSNNEIITKHQTSYEYDANHFFISENRIQPRLLYIEKGSLVKECFLPCNILDGFIPKNSFAVKHFFGNIASLKDYSGFFIDYDCSSNEEVDAFLRITFFENDGKGEYNVDAEDKVNTFMSSAKIHSGNGRIYFETSKLSFPDNIGEIKIELVSIVLSTRLTVNINKIGIMNGLDMRIKFRGQEDFYNTNAKLTFPEGRGLNLSFKNGFSFKSPDFPDNHDTICNMLMPLRNTIFVVMENKSSVSKIDVKLTSHTDNKVFNKSFEIEPNSDLKAYYFNFSDINGLSGRLKSFELSANNGDGEIYIYSYSFEQEKIIDKTVGKCVSCTATNETVTIKGTLKKALSKDSKVVLYRTSMADDEDRPQGKTLLVEKSLNKGEIEFKLETPMKYGKITELSSQFIMFIKNEDGVYKFTDRFYIENYKDFIVNKYHFELPNKIFNVLDFGAKGNAFTDDTDAIQRAIDKCSEEGGGQVLLPGDDSFYGKRYIFTNLLLRSNVDLHIAEGAILWQDQDPDDYCFIPFYGHDGYIAGVNWTHAMHVCNLPIIHCHNANNVKVTGNGKIRSMDTGSEEGVGMPGYSCGCPDRIHQITFGFFNSTNINLEDVEIVRANNYHMSLYHCGFLSVLGIKMYEVKCVSGDGIGLGSGGHDALLACNFLQSNDDAVTISSSYNDPREILWWHGVGNGVFATRNVEICHNYFCAGGGKCICFIPWGTVQTYQELTTIKNVVAYDNYLTSVNPVGSWPDDPFKGRFPFDNVEPDDYAPVQEVRIFDNIYDGNNQVYPLLITDLVTDCGIESPSDFLNKDFSLGGFANWQINGEVHHYFNLDNGKEHANIESGKLYQGLCLQKGEYEITAKSLNGFNNAKFFICKTPFELGKQITDCELVTEISIKNNEKEFSKKFEISASGNYYAGISAENTIVESLSLKANIDREAIKEERIASFMDETRKSFTLPYDVSPVYNDTDGKIFLHSDPKSYSEIVTNKEYKGFTISNAFEFDGTIEGNYYQYGFIINSKNCEYRFYIDNKTQRLILEKEENGKTTLLYEKTNFFFTSSSFHNFSIVRATNGELTCFVDNSMYCSVETNDETLAKAKVFNKNCKMTFNLLSIN